MKNRHIKYLIVLIILIFSGVHNHAYEKLSYYHQVLLDWGLVTNIRYEDKNIQDTFTLFLSSQQNEILDIKKYSYSIVICDTECSQPGARKVLLHESENGLEDVYIYDVPNYIGRTIYIPEYMLISSFHREQLSYFIRSLALSNSNLYTIDLTSPKGHVLKLFENTLYELGTYLLPLFILLFVLKKGVPRNLVNKFKLLGNFKSDENIKKSLLSYYVILIYIISVLILLYVPLSLAISVKDTGSISFAYIAKYTKDALDFGAIGSNPMDFSAVKMFMLLYLSFFFLNVVLAFIPILFIAVSHGLVYTKERVFRYRFLKTIFFLSLLVASVLPFFANFKIILVYLIYLFFLSFLLSFIVDSNKHFKYPLISKVDVVLWLPLIFIILLSSVIYRFKFANTVELEFLFDPNLRVVSVPYTQYINTDTRFRDYGVPIGTDIFANEYMLSGHYNVDIENIPLEEFIWSDNFIILSNDREKLMQEIFTNNTLREFLIGEEYSPNMYFDDISFEDGAENEYYLDITLECFQEIYPFELMMTVYSEEYFENMSVLLFSGCSKPLDGKKEIQQLQIPVRLKKLVSSPLILEFVPKSVNGMTIDITLYKNGTIQHPKYLHFNNDKGVIIDKFDRDDMPVKVYSSDIDEHITYMESSENSINIASRINNLIEKGFLVPKLRIWSKDLNLYIIKNDL